MREISLLSTVLSFKILYVGDSLPTEDWSDENMVYLSSEQALADVANFVQEMNGMYGLTGPWVTFGGSYAGSLSAWARQT